MQSFKYAVPTSSATRRLRRGRPWLRLCVTAVAVAALGGAALKWGGPLAQSATGSAGWLLGNPASAGVAQRDAEALLKEGEALLRRGEAAAAVQRFDAALRADPTHLPAFQRALDARYVAGAKGATSTDMLKDDAQRLEFELARGQADLEAGRLPAALGAYDAAGQLAPRDPRGLIGRAQVLVRQEKYPEAIRAYEEAWALAPADMSLATALIALRYKLGDYEGGVRDALATFQPLAATSESREVQVGLIEAYVRQGLTPGEVRDRHRKAAPQLAEVDTRLCLAEAYLRHYVSNPNWHKGSYDQAIAACKAVFAAKPDAERRTEANRQLARLHAARAERHYARSEFDPARAEMRQALALQRYLPDDRRLVADLYVQQAHLLAVNGKAQALTRGLEAALAIDATHPCRADLARLYANEGLGMLGIGKAREAVRPLQRAVRLSPEDPKLFVRLHQALERSHVATPLQVCGQAAGLKDAGARTLQLVRGYVRFGMRNDARRAVAEATRAGIAAPMLAGMRAELALADQQTGQARQLLHAALKQRPDAALWSQLGSLELMSAAKQPEYRKKRLEAAQAAFKQALVYGPDDKTRGKLLGVHRVLAEYALERKDYAAAAAYAAPALVLAPSNPWLALALGTAQARQGLYVEAEAALTAGLTGIDKPDHPAHARVREQLGQVCRAQKQYAAAIEHFRAALAEEVGAPPAQSAGLYYELAFVLSENGQREEALNAIRQYVFWSQHDPRQQERVAKLEALELDLIAQRG